MTRRRMIAAVLFVAFLLVGAVVLVDRYALAPTAGTDRSGAAAAAPAAQDSSARPSASVRPDAAAVASPRPLPGHLASRRPSPSPDPAGSPRATPPPGGSSPPATRPPGSGATGDRALEDAVVALTNQRRAGAGCPALRNDERLRQAARAHSQDMKARGFFSHDSPDGRTAWDRMRAAGYPAPAAENIARGYPTAAAVVEGWMNSPGHRANILNCSYKAIGVGVATGSGGPWWTQDFGSQ